MSGAFAGRAAASPAGLPERLRAETRDAHEAVERALDWERRLGTLEGYRGFLARLYGFHVVWEPAAAALIADDAFLVPRRKLPLLLADLAFLGLTPAEVERLPRCAPVPMADAAEALGSMYVLEGSTLGGQILARHVAARLGLDAARGCAYLRAYGGGVGPMWQGFRARLLGVSSPQTQDAVVRSAAATFERLETWLSAG